MPDASTRAVLLIGTIPLPSSALVFEAVGARLGGLAPAVPDGETGPRLAWIGWQFGRLKHLETLQMAAEMPLGGKELPQTVPVLKLRKGVKTTDLNLHPLGYCDEAIKSYSAFKEAKARGRLPASTRFQVSIPSALILSTVIQDGDPRGLLAAFERAAIDEVRDICEAIPHEELAIQWDMVEPEAEEYRRHPGAGKPLLKQLRLWWSYEEGAASIGRISAAIPASVNLGVHLCYGDPDGTHVIEPHDGSVLRDIANALSVSIPRRLDWIHMPVPIERHDDAYFAPFRTLKLAPETRIYLGLVHQEDGTEGAAQRIAAARKVIPNFGVATECGLGRLPPNTIGYVLDLYRKVAELP